MESDDHPIRAPGGVQSGLVSFYEIDGVAPVADPSAFVHPLASVIGDVIIGPDCYIGPGASLRGDFGRILVGAGSNVQDARVVHAFPGADAVLEEESHVGHGAILHGCRVGAQTLVGMNSVVMDGAELGTRSLVGACSCVRAGTTWYSSRMRGPSSLMPNRIGSGRCAANPSSGTSPRNSPHLVEHAGPLG
jgi:carbonic anhydrase/acetyltransferase-like protein (isoleucine patch superfamily)